MQQTIVAVYNQTRGLALAERVEVASSMWTRGRGLLGRQGLAPGNGLLIIPCNSIHSFFMRFVFDAVFLDRENRVVHLISAMKPWRASPIIRRAHAVLELPAGAIGVAGVQVGDALVLRTP